MKSTGKISDCGFGLFGNGEKPMAMRGSDFVPEAAIKQNLKFVQMSVGFPWTLERKQALGKGRDKSSTPSWFPLGRQH